MWMEGKRAKTQWVAEISDDVSKYGPVGMPKEALFDFLYQGLEMRNAMDHDGHFDCAGSSCSDSSAKVSVRCSLDDCSKAMTLELTVTFSRVWTNTYRFVLAWKEVSKAEIMAAKLRDAEEEIAHLKDVLKTKEDMFKMNTRPIFKFYHSPGRIDFDGRNTFNWDPLKTEVMFGEQGMQDHLFMLDGYRCHVQRGGAYRITVDATPHNLNGHSIVIQVYSFQKHEKLQDSGFIYGCYYSMILNIPTGANIVVSNSAGVAVKMLLELLQ